MKILIIAPKYRDRYGEYYEFPLGLACISAVLKRDGWSVECLNLNHRPESSVDAIVDCFKESTYGIVCTGGLSAHYNKIEEIVKTVRSINSSIKIIIGGGIISSEPQLIYEALGVDYGVLQEGEITICELVKAINDGSDVSKVKGIIYKNEAGNSVITAARESIEDLDTLPFPDYEGFEVGKYLDMQMPNDNYYMYPFDKPRILPVISTRSCPFSCTFCYHPLGKKYRKNSLDYFFCWLEMLIDKYQINMVAILDELFSVNKERMMEFANRMKRYGLLWIAQMRVDDVNDEILQKLKESGCFYISYGIESADDSVLKSMKKKIKISSTEKALELTRKHNIGIQGNLIFGDPNETIETANASLKWWKNNRQYQINLGLIEPYPGTPIYINAVRDGKIKDRLAFIKSGCPPINLSKMSDEEYSWLSAEIWTQISKNHIFAEVLSSKLVGEVPFKGKIYSFDVRCPHCNSIINYNNMHQAEKGVFKLGCRVCNQRFDLSPVSVFKDNFESQMKIIERLNELKNTKQEISVIPCIPEFKFFALMSLLCSEKDLQKLNIVHCLDGAKHKIGSKYLNKIIEDYTIDGFIESMPADMIFFIPPTHLTDTANAIKQQLIDRGISEQNIIMVNMGI